MGLFRREKHETTVQDVGFGNFNFVCTCGAHSRSGSSREEAVAKERLHKQATGR